jgi:mannosyltransferase
LITRSRHDLVLCVSLLALLAATALRFIALGRQSLWTDELFSVYWARAGAGFMFAHFWNETNPPLYYLILEVWMRVFGDGEAAVRLLSALLSAITVPVVYLLGKNMFGRQAGSIAALLYALSYWNLYYAQEARGYALLYLTFALALQCVQGIVAELRRGTPPLSAALGGHGIGFLLAAVASAWIHYVSIVIFGALGATITLIWWRPFAFDRRFLTCFAIVGVSAALLIAPTMFIAVVGSHSADISWIARSSLRGLAALAMGAPEEGGWFRRVSEGAAVILWAPLLVYGAWKHREGMPLFLAYLFPAIGFGILVFVSFISPILLNRTAMWISIPIYLGVAGAVSAVKHASARRLITGIILLSNLVSACGYFVYSRKEPWRSQIPEIAARVSGQDLVILGRDTPAIAFLYYHGAGVLPVLRRWPANNTASDILDEHATGIRPISSDEITTALSAGRSIHFISRDGSP